MVESSESSLQNEAKVSVNVVTLQVDLPNYESKMIDNKEVVFYIVKVCSGHRKWRLEKRFNEFYDLDKIVRQKHPNLPKLPAKTYFPLKNPADIENRRQELHAYLQDIVNIPDMRTNSAFRKFLEIDSQIPESVSY